MRMSRQALLAQRQILEVDYGAFMDMTARHEIGRTEKYFYQTIIFGRTPPICSIESG